MAADGETLFIKFNNHKSASAQMPDPVRITSNLKIGTEVKNTIKNYFTNRCDKGSYVVTFGNGCRTEQVSKQMKSGHRQGHKQTLNEANEKEVDF